MKRRLAALLLVATLLAGQSGPALAAGPFTASRHQTFYEFVDKIFKHVRSVFKITAQDEPTIPKPCTPGTPGCP